MKILVLSHVSDFIGGAEKSLLDIVDTWRAHDPSIDLRFIIRKPLGGMESELDARGIEYAAVDYTYWNDSNLPDTAERVYGNALRNTRAIKQIKKYIDEYQPDVVLTNSLVAPWAAFAAHYAHIPHVWMVREYGKLDHGRDFEIGEKETFEDIGALSQFVLANSKTLARYIAQYIDEKKIGVVYTPFDIEKIRAAADEQVPSPFRKEDSLKLVLTGNINPGKGHDIAVEAAGKLVSEGCLVELAVVGRAGEKAYMDKIQQLIERYKLKEAVHFLGFQSKPFAFARHADIAVMSSRQEAFGRVTFEYQAIGLPVVGSNSGATPELVVDGKTGLLYTAGDSNDMATKIKQYYDRRSTIDVHARAALQNAQAMMEGECNALHALNAIKRVAEGKSDIPHALNYTYRWLDFPEDAQRYMRHANKEALTKIAKVRAKNYLRPHYHTVKSALSKVKRRR